MVPAPAVAGHRGDIVAVPQGEADGADLGRRDGQGGDPARQEVGVDVEGAAVPLEAHDVVAGAAGDDQRAPLQGHAGRRRTRVSDARQGHVLVAVAPR